MHAYIHYIAIRVFCLFVLSKNFGHTTKEICVLLLGWNCFLFSRYYENEKNTFSSSSSLLRVIRVLHHVHLSGGFPSPKLLVFLLSYSYVLRSPSAPTTLYYFWFLLFLFEIYVSFFRRCSPSLLGLRRCCFALSV